MEKLKSRVGGTKMTGAEKVLLLTCLRLRYAIPVAATTLAGCNNLAGKLKFRGKANKVS